MVKKKIIVIGKSVKNRVGADNTSAIAAAYVETVTPGMASEDRVAGNLPSPVVPILGSGACGVGTVNPNMVPAGPRPEAAHSSSSIPGLDGSSADSDSAFSAASPA